MGEELKLHIIMMMQEAREGRGEWLVQDPDGNITYVDNINNEGHIRLGDGTIFKLDVTRIL